MYRDARFSPCRMYRYTLSRVWEHSLPQVVFIALNPSTADANKDDPTVKRCISFAQNWGFGKLSLVNLFAYKATDPSQLLRARDPIGPDNDFWIAAEISQSARVVAAWGNHGGHLTRADAVLGSLEEVYCLGTTKDGSPRHPLYLPSATEMQLYRTKPAHELTT